MRLQLPENALVTLLRQYYTSPRCQLQPQVLPRKFHTFRHIQRPSRPSSASFAEQRRAYQHHNGGAVGGDSNDLQFAAPQNSGYGAPSSQRRPNIAILGGGITGLSAAHYLTRELPTAKITIYEASERLGGWLQSKSVDVGGGKVVFESGVRTLRPSTVAGLVAVEMIEKLGLREELIVTSTFSDAARNRFVYYPDRLVKMPGPGQDPYSMVWSIFTEPVFKGLGFGAIFEFNRPQRETWAQYNNPEVDDESVASFLERRLGTPDVGNNLVSAVLHGIYAGDINRLSARSLMQKFWYEEALHGSLTRATIKNLQAQAIAEPYNDVILRQKLQPKISQEMNQTMAGASVYTFKEGIGALSKALEKSLRANGNVEFKLGHKVKSVEHDTQSNGISVTITNDTLSPKYSNVISTLYGRTLSEIANVPSLASMQAVTVMVVNLFYEEPDLLPERGFGYLIPRSIPFEQNPECALGVVFDSDATIGQDTVPGTKVTVMLGGHWWDGLSFYPDEEEGAAMARSILSRHLNITEQPSRVNVALQRDCIPQYTVGHEARMKKAHAELMSEYKGRLQVAGNSYAGIGLNDCVRAARDVVMQVKDEKECTGLEDFTVPKAWAQMKIAQIREVRTE